ncbi:MAG: MBL fold metallo-hydrolase [Hyphomicrobiales bacterium]|nr:MBL fold metallo-hydrolase [Hyphomicrobiales bacterium]
MTRPTPAPLAHSTEYDPPAGVMEQVSPLVRRMTAPNAGPFTFKGTCVYIVGRGDVAVIDPGPADEAHIAALAAGLGDERIAHIVVTHTHKDHSPGARLLAERTGARIVGCAPYAPPPGPPSGLDASHDRDYAPQRILGDGERLSGDGFDLVAVATPGHAANHLCFALPQERALFSGDHVMAWSTSVVAPPDGNMTDYMASLAKLRARDEAIFWPGHGGPVTDPQRYMRGLAHHRLQREAAILRRLEAGDETIAAMTPKIYENLDPRLGNAAAFSMLAHLQDLVARGIVASEGAPDIGARYRLV